MTEVKSKIEKLYPAAFETLTYQNYKAKFHSLLFIEEIEVNIKFIINIFSKQVGTLTNFVIC